MGLRSALRGMAISRVATGARRAKAKRARAEKKEYKQGIKNLKDEFKSTKKMLEEKGLKFEGTSVNSLSFRIKTLEEQETALAGGILKMKQQAAKAELEKRAKIAEEKPVITQKEMSYEEQVRYAREVIPRQMGISVAEEEEFSKIVKEELEKGRPWEEIESEAKKKGWPEEKIKILGEFYAEAVESRIIQEIAVMIEKGMKEKEIIDALKKEGYAEEYVANLLTQVKQSGQAQA